MSATLSILRGVAGNKAAGEAEIVRNARSKNRETTWDAENFAREQIRGLVGKVFFPGGPQPARQVVFSAADPEMDVSGLCMRTASAGRRERRKGVPGGGGLSLASVGTELWEDKQRRR